MKIYGYEINNIDYNGKQSEIDIRKPDSYWSSNIKFFIDKREPTFVVYCQETAGHIDRKLWKAINEKVKELGWEE